MMATFEIKKRVIEGAASGPHLLVTGGVHGDEFEPMVAIRWLMNNIQADQLRGRLTLIPIANEPAFFRGRRTADDELDLARTCPGRVEGSITERIAHAISDLIRRADYYIDLHTGGTALCILPFVGFMLHHDPGILDRQRRMARAFNLPIIWGTAPAFEGRTLSIARDARVPAIYAEFHGGGQCNPHGVDAYVEGCLNVMRELRMIERALPESKVVHMIDDPQPNSGHLQICHPAPLTGFFEPTIELGQHVRKGELVGRIIGDALGEQVCEIRSEHSGIVLCLATFPRVSQGTGVAVVLDLDRDGLSNKNLLPDGAR